MRADEEIADLLMFFRNGFMQGNKEKKTCRQWISEMKSKEEFIKWAKNVIFPPPKDEYMIRIEELSKNPMIGKVKMMCVEAATVNDLCELYPKTG